MYDLEQMMETTKIMLKETKRREKALKWILHVLNFAVKQNSRTKISIVLLLNYEKQRQEALVEQLWQQHRISKGQKEEYKKSIQTYQKYVGILMNKIDVYQDEVRKGD